MLEFKVDPSVCSITKEWVIPICRVCTINSYVACMELLYPYSYPQLGNCIPKWGFFHVPTGTHVGNRGEVVVPHYGKSPYPHAGSWSGSGWGFGSYIIYLKCVELGSKTFRSNVNSLCWIVCAQVSCDFQKIGCTTSFRGGMDAKEDKRTRP